MVVKASGLEPGFEAWSPLRNSVLIRSLFNSSLLTEADAAEGLKIGRLVVPEPSMPGPSPLLMNLETVPFLTIAIACRKLTRLSLSGSMVTARNYSSTIT